MSERISKLAEAVEVMHSCKATHTSTEAVAEMFGSKVVWAGVVESYDLSGHSEAKQCYAWSYIDDSSEIQYLAVLKIPPVTSAKTAVQAAIASGHQK